MDTVYINYEARILQNVLTMNLNESKAPMEVKRVILENLLSKVTAQADSIVKDEEFLIKNQPKDKEETQE